MRNAVQEYASQFPGLPKFPTEFDIYPTNCVIVSLEKSASNTIEQFSRSKSNRQNPFNPTKRPRFARANGQHYNSTLKEQS